MSRNIKPKDNSYKIRWKSAKEKAIRIASINAVKGNLSVNEWVKKLIDKETRGNSKKNNFRSLDSKLDKLLILSENLNTLSKISEAELRTFFWFVVNKLDIDVDKGFKQLDLDGVHGVHEKIINNINTK